jgi:enoyl-CoA hydratase/carnithine racemase
MTYENVLVELDKEVLIITLNWVEHHNALTQQMRADLLDCVYRAEANLDVKAIVITGAGKKAFSAGTNISELDERTLHSEMSRASDPRKNLPTALERLAKPSIAAINGYCFGGGLELVLGCTIRIASPNARLGLPEITLGQIPGSGGTQRLYRFVGLGWAMQMILTGEPISAEEALRIGLVTELVPQDALLDRAKALARLLGSRAPMAFVAGRDAVLRSTETDLLNGIDYEKKLYAICMATQDSRAGLRAYRDKQPAIYTGK